LRRDELFAAKTRLLRACGNEWMEMQRTSPSVRRLQLPAIPQPRVVKPAMRLFSYGRCAQPCWKVDTIDSRRSSSTATRIRNQGERELSSFCKEPRIQKGRFMSLWCSVWNVARLRVSKAPPSHAKKAFGFGLLVQAISTPDLRSKIFAFKSTDFQEPLLVLCALCSTYRSWFDNAIQPWCNSNSHTFSQHFEVANKIQRITCIVPRFFNFISFYVHTNMCYRCQKHLSIPNIISLISCSIVLE